MGGGDGGGVRSYRTPSSRGSNAGLIWTLLFGYSILTDNVRIGWAGVGWDGGGRGFVQDAHFQRNQSMIGMDAAFWLYNTGR